uniref:Putative disease resistance protein n=1 Tax=Noccaea caerulescens TaxID=107243 RepID=A0A1J3CTE4_NOCCA
MYTNGEIVMHKLLQQVATKAVYREEPQKRQVLVDAQEICDVLEGAEGSRAVSGISFDISGINEVSVSKRAFKTMQNLRFLKVYKSKDDGNDELHIPEELDLPPRLRLLQWQAFPSKCLPPTFHPEHLIELDMKSSKLEKLWKGTQPLTNLRKMDLSYSRKLKKLPDLLNASNLEKLDLSYCKSLVELPTSIANLHNLQELCMQSCTNLEVLPTNINLASLEKIDMSRCSRLRIFPDISTNVGQLFLSGTAVKEVPASICLWSRVRYIDLSHCINLKRLTNLPTAVKCLNLSNSGVERITYCMRDLHGLEELNVSGCRNLESLPELPTSITLVTAEDCESLARVTHPLNIPHAQLNFTNCFKLGGEARRLIIQRSFLDGIACLPGSVIPSVFNHRAKGNCLTIGPFSASSRFEACVIISPDQHQYTREDIYLGLRYRILGKSGDAIYRNPVSVQNPSESPEIQTKHLCIFHCDLPREEICLEVGIEILFELSNSACGPLDDCEITECGVRILTDEWERSSDDETKNNGGINQVSDWSYEFEKVSKVLEDFEDEFVVTSDSEASQDCD